MHIILPTLFNIIHSHYRQSRLAFRTYAKQNTIILLAYEQEIGLCDAIYALCYIRLKSKREAFNVALKVNVSFLNFLYRHGGTTI